MATLHLVPHTHWDREWYLPFQAFRLKLVHMMDLLLDTLERDPAFAFFTLDGQTIVLEDYLELRPERRSEVEQRVTQGQLLIGPWYVLPDEFLVSPEALVRNLLAGQADGRAFGACMDVGYEPDPFGHIGQLPQILAGFGIRSAAFRRGLDDEPCELWWDSPDGTRTLAAYLREGYDNACRLPVEPEAFASAIAARRDALAPHCRTSQRLLLNGTDHQEPQAEVAGLVVGAWPGPDALRISTLPLYLEAVRREVEAGLELPVVRGELRSPKKHHLLPAVLSSRSWIKQRNHACGQLLERWAEPFSAWAELLAAVRPDRFAFTGHIETPRIRQVQPLLRHAWRMLLQCQPHDSICGCSIDAVHEEMRTRFAQVEQIGEELTRQALQALADEVDTGGRAPEGAAAALVVYNPSAAGASGQMRAAFDLPAGLETFEVVDQHGRPIAYRLLDRQVKVLADFDLDPEGLRGMLAMAQDGRVFGLAVQAAAVVPQAGGALVDVVLHEHAEPNLELLAQASEKLDLLLTDPSRPRIRLRVRLASRAEIEMLAPQIPACGLRTLWLRPAAADPPAASCDSAPRIANDIFDVEAAPDGTLRLRDRRTGRSYTGLARFSDLAECGDSYTHSPLAGDAPRQAPEGSARIERWRDALGETLHVTLPFSVPRGLRPDRSGRSAETVPLPIRLTAHLAPGIARLDLSIEVENAADDHRLQVHFPTGAPLGEAWYGGAFEVVRRPTALAAGGADWAEQPAAEVPLRGFVSDRPSDGLLIAACGLREASASPGGDLSVTLLRCFGWLSRDDLATRKGAAGPLIETPGGQQHGLHRFELSIIPFGGDLLSALPLVESFDLGLRAVMTPLHAGRLPTEASFLSVEPQQLQLTATKVAEDGLGMVVRLVNPTPADVPAVLTCLLPLQRAQRARLDETAEGSLPVLEGRRVLVPLGPHQAATVRLGFAET